MKSKIPFRRICWLGFKADIPMPGMGVSFSVRREGEIGEKHEIKMVPLAIIYRLARQSTDRPILHWLRALVLFLA
jgi:hypothetical protein